jgi:hypothetical protein
MESGAENPPLATVNTHLLPRPQDRGALELGGSTIVGGGWEAVDERRW